MSSEREKPLLLVVAVALLDGRDRVLLQRRPAGKPLAGMWEFPGGKIEPGETPESSLVRELKEELDIELREKDLLPFTFASHDYSDFHLLMPLYICRRWRGEVAPQEGQAVEWIALADMRSLPMPPADEPLVAALEKGL